MINMNIGKLKNIIFVCFLFLSSLKLVAQSNAESTTTVETTKQSIGVLEGATKTGLDTLSIQKNQPSLLRMKTKWEFSTNVT